MPRIGHIGRARLGTTLTLLLRGALPNVPAILLIGAPAMVALDPLGMTGCTRYADLAGLSWFTFTDADGLARLPLALPPAPNFLVGLRLDCQWATGDPGRNPAGLVSSDALAATFH